MNILYLEDNLHDFELVSNIIHEIYINCSIIHVNNQSDFLKQLTEKDFDIIIADYYLPDYDGFTALTQAKEETPDTPFIIITDVLKEESTINSLKHGATDFVSKNQITYQLVPAIERALCEKKNQLQQKELVKQLVDLEKKINDQEELLQKLTKRVRGFLRIELPTCKYSLVDKFLEELSGYPLGKWFNTPNFLYEIIHPEFRDYFSINSNKMKEGLVPKVLEYKIIRQDGEERWWLQFNIGAYNTEKRLISVSSVIIDNTENKEREIKYQNLFENVIGGIFRIDIETGLIIEANQKLVETMGYKSKEEVRNKVRPTDFYYHPEQPELVMNELRTKGIVEDYEFQLKKSDGTPVCVSLSAKLYPKDGYIEGIIIDITKRKLAEEKLITEKNKTKKYLDIAGSIIVVIDIDQNVKLINMKGCKILGYTEEEIIGKNWIENFLPQRIQDGVRDTFRKAIKRGIRQEENFINFILTKSGEERIISWYNTYLQDSHGAIEAIVSSGEDITERRKIEQQQQMLSNIIESSSEVILSTDENGMIIFVNEAVKKVFGWTVENVLGKNLSLFSHHGWKLIQNSIMENTEKLNRKTIESVWLHKNGVIIPVIVTITPFYDSIKKQQTFNIIVIDISQVKKLEDSLKRNLLNFELLRNIMKIRDKAKNIDELLETILYTVLNSLDFSGGAIYLIDEQQEKAILQKSLGLSKDFMEEAKNLKINDCRFRNLFIKGAMLLIEDIANVDYAHSIAGFQSIIAFPLILNDNVIGALFLAHKEKRAITEDDKWIIETICVEISDTIIRFKEYNS